MSEVTPKSGSESSAREQALIDAARLQVADLGTSMTPQEGLPAADSFPNYQLIREIHRGGQGVVYLAIQKTTKRKVAIKVMREGPFAGGAERARFEREVQILAQLKHPNIVGIHDSGVAGGSFFYVMDYISGQPLDAWITGEPRPIREVLGLFLKVCDAVGAAHLKGVIHRDIKPSNVRVDASGEPQVVDFGLAKTISGDVAESSQAHVMMTMTGQFVGSLPWASPEQAEGLPDKIDVRTDVYSLGVVFYQLLTGKFPYQVVGNMRDVLDRILRSEPARPSTIRRQIDDELETIVLKCLSKERERRYQSAGELARDLRHYLAGEPIEAKRDSGWYLLKKTLKRYRPYAAVAAAMLLLIVGFAAALSVQNQRLTDANKKLTQANGDLADANTRLRIAEQEARLAQAKADNARSATLDTFELIDPLQAGGQDLTLREAMDQVEAGMRIKLKDMPDALADLTQLFAQIAAKMGDSARALRLTREVEQIRPAGGMPNLESIRTLNIEGVALRNSGQPGDIEQAEHVLRTAVARVRRHPEVLPVVEFAIVQMNLARCLDGSLKPESSPRLEEARGLYEDSLAMLDGEPVSPERDRARVVISMHLGAMLVRAGRYDESAAVLPAAIDTFDPISDEDRVVIASVKSYLALARHGQGRLEEADEMHRAAIADMARLYEGSPANQSLLEMRANYARFLGSVQARRFEESAALWSEILEQARKGGLDNAAMAVWLAHSAPSLVELRRLDEAEERLLAAEEIIMDSRDPRIVQMRKDISARLASIDRLRKAGAGASPDGKAELPK